MGIDITVDLGNHALESLTGAALGEVVGTVGNHILHTLRPTDTAGELRDEVGLNLGGIGMGLAIHILVDGALGCLDLRLLDGSLEFVLGGLHQRRMEGTTHLQRQGALGTGSLQLLAGLIDGIDIAILLTSAHTSSTFSSGRAMMAAIVEGWASQAFCIAIARA